MIIQRRFWHYLPHSSLSDETEINPVHFEIFERVDHDRFTGRYGCFRFYAREVIYRYLNSCIHQNGLGCVKCKDCVYEYLPAFSCKRRHYCPSCHQKRILAFGEWLREKVLKATPNRHLNLKHPKDLPAIFPLWPKIPFRIEPLCPGFLESVSP